MYTRSSSALAMGGVRQQFGSAINIQMAQYSIEFLKALDDSMTRLQAPGRADLHQRGYLFLADTSNAESLQHRFRKQVQLGARVKMLSRSEIASLVPGMKVDDLEFAVLGEPDGYANPRGVLECLRTLAMYERVPFIEGEVVRIEQQSGAVSAVVLRSGEVIRTKWVVNAAGAYAGAVSRIAGLDSPVRPQRQHLFRVALPHTLSYRFPMV